MFNWGRMNAPTIAVRYLKAVQICALLPTVTTKTTSERNASPRVQDGKPRRTINFS